MDLPEFGCGLRRLLFAPNSEPLVATTRILVRQSLERWLGDRLELLDVRVDTAEESQVLVRVEYVLLETRASRVLEVRVR